MSTSPSNSSIATEAAGREVIPILKEDFREVLPAASHAGAGRGVHTTVRDTLHTSEPPTSR